MARYKTHCFINFVFLVPLLWGLTRFQADLPELLTFTVSYSYSTLYMTPDVDLTHTWSRFSHRWIFGYPFRSYARFFAHRRLSHRLLWGTVTRILWLALFFVPLLVGIYFLAPHWIYIGLHFLRAHPRELIFALIAPFLADSIHLAVDTVS
jgi:uncharacterized metal-binding protein